jgi:hypothetical protein
MLMKWWLTRTRLAVAVIFGMLDFAPPAEPVDYLRDIKPILKSRCYACHGALKQESGLRVDTGHSLRQGGDNGPAVVPEEAETSPLIARVSATDADRRMPPEGEPLTAMQIAALKQWIAEGAASPDNEQPETDPRQHWSFQRLRRPTVPVGDGSGRPGNPIDAFVSAELSRQGLVPLPAAGKQVLLRRVYLDLIGIPPTADELREFLDDVSPEAYERVVQRLLASPQHGERWARHWMDVWRYSDWYGRRAVPDVMNSYPMIWRWRDWIVRSINVDKGYDRMIVEMLAADEVMPHDDENLVATGYLVRSWFKWNYETWKKDLVEHTGKAFLGMTLNCAQCHDHKYDPIGQEEYFRFRAFFEPLELRHDRVAGEPDPGPFEKYVYGKPYGPIKSGMVRVFDEKLDAQTFMFAKGDSRLRMDGRPAVTPAAPAVLGGDTITPTSLTLPTPAAYPGLKPFVQSEERAARQSKIAVAEAELVQARAMASNLPAGANEEHQAAEAALATARQNALSDKATALSPVLSGMQSLVLDAKMGRAALAHPLPGIENLAPSGTVSYLLQIVVDGHTNLQLALDIEKGLTGGWIGFEQGKIKSYSPGGFQEIVVGAYDLTKGQNRFKVVLQLDLPNNQFALTVTSLAENQVLVNATPVALNGWQPAANGKRGLYVDCRPGTEAVYDDLSFAQPDGSPLLSFDFEAPTHPDGHDVVEAGGWIGTSFNQAPATAKVCSAVALNPQVQAAVARLAAAQRVLELPASGIAAAEARLTAAQRELASLECRIEADAARYASGRLAADSTANPAIVARIQAACQSEREAALAAAKAQLAAADFAIATAAAKTVAAKDQAVRDAAAKESLAAQQQRSNALNAIAAANANLGKPPGEYSPLSPKYPETSTGRRAALAQWIADRNNPLTARVAVNHLWLRHFGRAIVETTHDFGSNGSRPTHPELLDWLACELIDSGWSMKHLHQLMVTSETYRRASHLPASLADASGPSEAARRIDPDNRTYWRFPPARMQAEVVRDSLLAISGELDGTMGGHELDHKLGLSSRRRSLYFAYHGEEKMEFLELFDAANPLDCYQRTSSIQPQQALALTNSELTSDLSRVLAARLWTHVTESTHAADPDVTAEFVKRAFLQILNQEPRPAELSASIDFLQRQATRLAQPEVAAGNIDPAVRARENLVHALMNHNEFVTIR